MASDDDVPPPISKDVENESTTEDNGYWTRQRMRSAEPLPLPGVSEADTPETNSCGDRGEDAPNCGVPERKENSE